VFLEDDRRVESSRQPIREQRFARTNRSFDRDVLK
jgi:hypothetical protein